MDPRNAYQMVSMLEGVVERGTAKAALVIGKPLAGKTGTTNDSKDAWFVGFSPDLVVAVFVGFDQPQPMGKRETGATVALPIWIEIMQEALRTSPGRRSARRPGSAWCGSTPPPGSSPAAPATRDRRGVHPGHRARARALQGSGERRQGPVSDFFFFFFSPRRRFFFFYPSPAAPSKQYTSPHQRGNGTRGGNGERIEQDYQIEELTNEQFSEVTGSVLYSLRDFGRPCYRDNSPYRCRHYVLRYGNYLNGLRR